MNWVEVLRLSDLHAEEARVKCLYVAFHERLMEMREHVTAGFVDARYVGSGAAGPPTVEAVHVLQGRMVVLDAQCKDMAEALERLNARQAEQVLGQEKT